MNIEDLIAKHEGKKADVYNDSMGIPTVGIGHNIKANPLPAGYTPPLTDDQIDFLFQADLTIATNAVTAALPWFANLDPVRQAVIVDMAFNIGIGALLTFHHTLGYMESSDWQYAANGMLASKWAAQVGFRAREDAHMMLSGLWPDDPNFSLPEIQS